MEKYKQVSLTLIFFCLCATSYAESSSGINSSKCNSQSECTSEPENCKKICGCDGIYKIDVTTGECTIDYDFLRERTKSTNAMHTGEELILNNDDGLAKKIREDTERVFQGIMYCAIFFVICASICVISVCIFCFRIHYSDQKLKKEVKALASKMNVDYRKKTIKKKLRDVKEESCNVIVEDADIMCV